jgi:DNA-binding XRE family transcriptional regulator
MVQGRKPDLKRRRQVATLRARGLSLVAIGRMLGVSHQCVQEMLHRIANPRVLSVPCSSCGRQIVSPGALPGDKATALCLPCLRGKPKAPFGQRLKAYRLAAGLTQAELASRAEINAKSIWNYESCDMEPRERNRARLIKVLGAGLMTSDRGEPASARKRKGK